MRRMRQVVPTVAVLEAVVRAGGTIAGDALFMELRKSRDISFGEFLKLLMVLELRGFVRVTTISEEKFFVHITERALKILTTKEEPESD